MAFQNLNPKLGPKRGICLAALVGAAPGGTMGDTGRPSAAHNAARPPGTEVLM
jgi:hypothetical protein